MNDNRRLIEDHLPIDAIARRAPRRKSVRIGPISARHHDIPAEAVEHAAAEESRQ